MLKFVDRTRGAFLHNNRWWVVIFRDIHFWVPVAVLVGGLLVLRWIS